MATQKKSKSTFTRVGTLRRKDEKSSSYLVLNKNVEVLDDGKPVDLGQFRTVKLIDPLKGLETMLNNGTLKQDEYDERVEALSTRGVMYDMVVVTE